MYHYTDLHFSHVDHNSKWEQPQSIKNSADYTTAEAYPEEAYPIFTAYPAHKQQSADFTLLRKHKHI